MMRPYINLLITTAILLSATDSIADPLSDNKSVAKSFARLFTSFESYVTKIGEETLILAMPHKGAVEEGVLANIKTSDGKVIGYLLIDKVYKNHVVANILAAWEPLSERNRKGLLATGIKTPVRIVWTPLFGSDERVNSYLVAQEKEARDIQTLDIAPSSVSSVKPERIRSDGLKKVISKMAKKGGALYVAMHRAEAPLPGDNRGKTSLDLYDGRGDLIMNISGEWLPEASNFPASGIKPGIGDDDSTSIVGLESRLFSGKWNGLSVHAGEDNSASMKVREHARIRKYELPGAVLSAVMIELADGSDAIAVLMNNRLKIMKANKGTLSTVGEATSMHGMTPISLMAYDLNRDGHEELIVNGFTSDGLYALFLDPSKSGAPLLAEGMNYYFSVTADGALLAQKGVDGVPVPGPDIFSVNVSNNRLSFAPLATLSVREAPLGINRADLDSDGVYEFIALSRRGALLIFSSGGKAVWRGEGFGYTQRIIKAGSGIGRRLKLAVPPRIVVTGEQSNNELLLAVGGAEYKSGGLFSKGQLRKGSVKFIKIKRVNYSIEDSYIGSGGYISDLISGRDGRPVGFIRVTPGVMNDKSVLAIPIN